MMLIQMYMSRYCNEANIAPHHKSKKQTADTLVRGLNAVYVCMYTVHLSSGKNRRHGIRANLEEASEVRERAVQCSLQNELVRVVVSRG